MAACKHPQWTHELRYEWLEVRVKPTVSHDLVAILKIACAECKEPILFKGEPGWSTGSPTTSADATELRVPLVRPLIRNEVADVDKVPN